MRKSKILFIFLLAYCLGGCAKVDKAQNHFNPHPTPVERNWTYLMPGVLLVSFKPGVSPMIKKKILLSFGHAVPFNQQRTGKPDAVPYLEDYYYLNIKNGSRKGLAEEKAIQQLEKYDEIKMVNPIQDVGFE